LGLPAPLMHWRQRHAKTGPQLDFKKSIAGLTPILLERSLQAQFLIPMAISLGFGVLFGTGITLLLAPSLYMILDDAHQVLAGVKARFVPPRTA